MLCFVSTWHSIHLDCSNCIHLFCTGLRILFFFFFFFLRTQECQSQIKHDSEHVIYNNICIFKLYVPQGQFQSIKSLIYDLNKWKWTKHVHEQGFEVFFYHRNIIQILKISYQSDLALKSQISLIAFEIFNWCVKFNKRIHGWIINE